MDTRLVVKRISIMIGEKQYEKIVGADLNISGFIRDLIDDHFSDHSITLAVSRKTHDLYEKIVSNTGATDQDIEPLLVDVLRRLLDERLERIQALKAELD